MKKLTPFIILLSCLYTNVATAQDLYLKAGVGYAFPMPGQTSDQYGNTLNGSINHESSGSTSYNTKSASFSAGTHACIGGGLMFSKNVGVELNFDMNLAPKTYTELIIGLNSATNGQYDYTSERHAKSTVLIMPSLVLQTGGEGCNLYMRMGVALPVNTDMKMHETFDYQSGKYYEYNWNIQNYFSLGVTGAAGLKIPLSDKVTFWAEASMMYLALSREQRDLETVMINGTTYNASQVTGGVKTYNYTKNGTFDGNGSDVALSQPFSNIALNAGLSVNFKSKPKNKAQNIGQYK